MRAKQITYRTMSGGIKQVWVAYHLAKMFFGHGRTRKAALADYRAAEVHWRSGREEVPRDFHAHHTPRCVSGERERRAFA